MLFLVCAVLLAGNVVIYVGEDRKGPEITIPQDAITYVAGTDTSPLMEGVTATDNRDGDVTNTVTIENIIPNADKTEASVVYVAKDSRNNVTKETRKVQYTEDPNAAVQTTDADGADTQSTDGTDAQAQADPNAADQTAAGNETAQTDDGQAQNEAAIAALPADCPRFYLTQYAVEVERGAQINALSYVQDITDDKDSRDALYQGILIDGEVDTNTPGEYTLQYHVVDSDGNSSNIAQLRVTVK